MSAITRNLILGLAGNRAVAGVMTRHGLRAGAGRFVAGETLSSALQVTRELNRQGLAVTMDLLGESVRDPQTAKGMADACIEVLEQMAAEGLDANLSVKLTQMGLDLDPGLALSNMTRLQDAAIRLGTFIRIDMESSAVTDATLEIFRRLYERSPNVGAVIQSYLLRSPHDMKSLGALGANVRIVKGAYMEPPSIAYAAKEDTDRAFNRLVEQHLEAGCYTAVATHDDAIIAFTQALAREKGIPRTQFEFQMLYGIRTGRQIELAREGYRTRVYVPFGRDWYPYFVRRLAERPENLWFIARNLFRS